MSSTTLKIGSRALQSKLHRNIAAGHILKLNWKLLYVALGVSSAILLVFYIIRINELTQGVFLIKNYNKQMDSLTQENKNLQTNFAQVSFLGLVTQRAHELNFQKTDNVTYVQVASNSLAKK